MLTGPRPRSQLLRDELNKLDGDHASRHAEVLKRLADDNHWEQLEPEQLKAALRNGPIVIK